MASIIFSSSLILIKVFYKSYSSALSLSIWFKDSLVFISITSLNLWISLNISALWHFTISISLSNSATWDLRSTTWSPLALLSSLSLPASKNFSSSTLFDLVSSSYNSIFYLDFSESMYLRSSHYFLQSAMSSMPLSSLALPSISDLTFSSLNNLYLFSIEKISSLTPL